MSCVFAWFCCWCFPTRGTWQLQSYQSVRWAWSPRGVAKCIRVIVASKFSWFCINQFNLLITGHLDWMGTSEISRMQNHDLCWFFPITISSQDNGWVFGLDSYKMSWVETVLHSLRTIYTRDFPTWGGGCRSGDGAPSGCLIPKNFFGWWVDIYEWLKFGFPQQATPTHWLTPVGSLPGREFPHHQIRNCPLGRPTCSYVHHVFLIQFGPGYCRWPQPSWQASVVFFFKFA